MPLSRSKAVLELGKRLVAQLEDGEDLLACWMAHDLAEKIALAEKAKGKAKAAAEDACSKTILELWSYRDAMPRSVRPFRDLDPLIRTMESLDPERAEPRYFSDALRAAPEPKTDEVAQEWFQLATGLDFTARLLIAFALREAARTAASRAEPWVELAELAGAHAEIDAPLVRFVLRPEDRIETDAELELESMKRKLARLNSFVEMASAAAKELEARVSSAKAQSNDSN